MSINNRTLVDMFNFKDSSSGANVDIVTIAEGEQENGDYYNRRREHRATSPYRDRVQERYNRSLSPTGSPRLKRHLAPRSVSPFTRSLSPGKLPTRQSSPSKVYHKVLSPIKPPVHHTENNEEIRRLRFENLILQSKVETLEAENKSLKDLAAKQSHVTAEKRAMSRDHIPQMTADLAAANRQIERLKRENDDLTSQLYSVKVDRLENPKKPDSLLKDTKEDWTGCQADAIEHLCTENQRLREAIFDMNEQKLHVHRLLEQQGDTPGPPRRRRDSCQLENEQLSEERKRLLARLEMENEAAKRVMENYSKLKEEHEAALNQICSLQAQLNLYQTNGAKMDIENSTIKNLTERCSDLQNTLDSRQADFARQLQLKEAELREQVENHARRLKEIEDEVRRVSHVCDLMCQEKDTAIQTLQKQINTNAILSRSNEQLQNAVNEQSDRMRDFVYRQLRDSETINELKNDFEALLRERNELDTRLQQDKQVHLRRLAGLKEQIHLARLSFGSIIGLITNDNDIDNEKGEELLSQLAEVDAQLGALQREILDIERMEAENTKVDLDDLTYQFLKKSEQCEALQTQLSTSELEKSRLNKRQGELEGNLNDSRNMAESYETKYEDMRLTLHKKQIELDTLRAQINKVKIKIGILEDDKETVEAKSGALKVDNEKLCDNNVEMDKDLKQTRKKLHQKEHLSSNLEKQIEEKDSKLVEFTNVISQLQKGLSRSTIQIGLLNEEMRVSVRALLELNEAIDSEPLEEHLENLQDISKELETLELALEKTLGGRYDCLGDMPLRGTSGDKISQLIQEIDFCRENMAEMQGNKKGKDYSETCVDARHDTARHGTARHDTGPRGVAVQSSTSHSSSEGFI